MRVEPFLEDAVGMQQDAGRDEVPSGYVWSLLDFVPHVGAALRSRGAWQYASPVAGNEIVSMAWAPYLAGSKLIGAAATGDIYDVSVGAVTSVGTMGVPQKQNPIFWRDKLYLPAYNSQARALSFTGTFSNAVLPVSSLAGRHATVFRERLVLGRSVADPERVAFSKPGDPTAAWDAISFVDTNDAVEGLWAMRNQILVFHANYVEQIRGTTPPDSTLTDPLGDMQLGVMWDRAGCFDARSINGWQGNVIFADQRGVHITDGGLVRNMIIQGGLERLWRETFEPGFVVDLPGAVFGDYYLITPRVSSGITYTWVCHIPTRRWWRWKNIDAKVLVTGSVAPERLYGTQSSVKRVTDLTYTFYPSTVAEQVDANGVDVLPEVETGWLRMSKRAGLRRVYDMFLHYLAYRQSDPGTNLVEVSMTTTIEDTSYEVVGGYRQTTESKRRKLLVARQVEGLALKIRALQAMTDFRIHGVGMSVEAEEEHRVR